MSKPIVPKVDLLDINREPTDAELHALLTDMMETVNEEGKRALDAYMAELYKGIEEAAKEGVANAKKFRARHPWAT